MMKKAFTLMEVNLAMMIMAGGILSVVSLYSLGYRESSQSVDDMAAAAYAESIISKLSMVIGDTHLSWKKFKDIESIPSSEGWLQYIDRNTGVPYNSLNGASYFSTAISKYGSCKASGESVSFDTSLPTAPSLQGGDDTQYKFGIVVMHDKYSPIVKIGVRVTRKPRDLMSQPLYYTEVRFQGVMDETVKQ